MWIQSTLKCETRSFVKVCLQTHTPACVCQAQPNATNMATIELIVKLVRGLTTARAGNLPCFKPSPMGHELLLWHQHASVAVVAGFSKWLKSSLKSCSNCSTNKLTTLQQTCTPKLERGKAEAAASASWLNQLLEGLPPGLRTVNRMKRLLRCLL